MRFEYEREGKVHRVDLTDLGKGQVAVRWSLHEPADGNAEGELLAEREFELNAAEVGDAWSVKSDEGQVHDVRVSRNGSTRDVWLAGHSASFDFMDRHGAYGGAGGLGPGGKAEVSSPMPGRIVELPVEVGQSVEEGETVVVVEAMKMANQYRSPIAGTISDVRGAVGDAIAADKAIVLIEPH